MGDPPEDAGAATTDATPTTGPAEAPTDTTADDGLAEGTAAPAATGGESGLVPRSAAGTDTPATLEPIVLDLYFQVYPGKTTREGTNIGIPNVPYTIDVPHGGPPQSMNTDQDGHVQISLLPGQTRTLRIFNTEYVISSRATLEPVNQRHGMQRRLQMLGYNLGLNGAGVDGIAGQFTERALLDFQADTGLRLSGRADTRTRNKIVEDEWVGE